MGKDNALPKTPPEKFNSGKENAGPQSMVKGQVPQMRLSEVTGLEGDDTESRGLLEPALCCLYPAEICGLMASLNTNVS